MRKNQISFKKLLHQEIKDILAYSIKNIDINISY
jgi:hypothetical protein